MQQCVEVVRAEADNLEARSQELQGQLEKLKAGEHPPPFFIWEHERSMWSAQTWAGHLEVSKNDFVYSRICPWHMHHPSIHEYFLPIHSSNHRP